MIIRTFGLVAVLVAGVLGGTGCAVEPADGDDNAASTDDASGDNEMNADDSVSVEKIVDAAAAQILAKQKDAIVYAPRRMPKGVVGDGKNLHAFGEVYRYEGKTSWSIAIGVGRDCNGGNACTLAWFSGGAPDSPLRPNTEIAGFRVEYRDMSCGASCAPPSLSWQDPDRKGIVHTVAVKGTKAENRAVFRSAIRNVYMLVD